MSANCVERLPEPLGLVQLDVPPPEPPVPVPLDTTGSTLVKQTLNEPARSPPGICNCMSTGVPSVPVLVHLAGLDMGGIAQLGQVTSAKQTWPIQPFMNAGISLYGDTASEAGVALCENEIRTALQALLPVSVMLKHFA